MKKEISKFTVEVENSSFGTMCTVSKGDYSASLDVLCVRRVLTDRNGSTIRVPLGTIMDLRNFAEHHGF